MSICKHKRSFVSTLGILLVILALLVGAGCSAPAASPTAAAPAAATTASAPAAATTATTAAAATTAAPATTSAPAAANVASRDAILIGKPNPATGALSAFGEGQAWAADRVISAVNKEGGIFIKELNKKLPLKVVVADTQSDPTKAAELATKLILQDKVDIMEVSMTPETTNPVDATCERYSVPCVSLGTPVEAWLAGGPYKWTYHHFFTFEQGMGAYLDVCQIGKTNNVIGMVFPNDQDGATMGKLFPDAAKARGFKVVDPGLIPAGTKDFSAVINQFKQQSVEVVISMQIGPDFATFWRQAKQQNYSPKIVCPVKGVAFSSEAEALGGNLAEGLVIGSWWTPDFPWKSSLTGETCRQMADAWEKDNKTEWRAPTAIHYEGMEIVVDVLKRAQSLDKEKIRQALAETNLDTIFGHVQYNDKHWGQAPLVGAQWIKGKNWPYDLQLITNTGYTNIPVNAKAVFPLP